ncbi:MAG: cytochrome c biogenesis protein CcdA [Actinomycetota bacterium]|nr:cytochrome c biogenesis protein CcdA [Actinomycetota bacterium]
MMMVLAADLGDTFKDTVADGPLLVAMAVSLLVGTISFFSPCVLPLVPGYLSYVAGLAGTDVATSDKATAIAAVPSDVTRSSVSSATTVRAAAVRGRMVAGALLFVLGFTVVFTSFGAAFGGLGRVLLEQQRVITIVLGAITVVLGLAFLGLIPLLSRQWRWRRLPRAGLVGAPLLGVVFGLGWTPCLGPTLGAINSLAFTEASAWRGALLGFTYCLGLGIPFVLTALGAGRALRVSDFARRHAETVMKIGGGFLILIGILLVTGAWDQAMNWLRAWLASVGLDGSAL